MNKIILAIIFAFSISFAQAATIPNGGFETGDLTNWTASNGLVNVVTSQQVTNGTSNMFTTMNPTEGDYFAVLTANNPATTLTSDSFFVSVGDIVNFDWFFSAEDYIPYNDQGSFSIDLLVGNTLLSQVSNVGNYGLTGWNTFSVTSNMSGNVSAIFKSLNIGDNALDSTVGIDNFNITSVPEPSTLALMVIGFLGAGFSLRRQRNTVALS